jgi:hypothetical protein
MSRRLDKNQIMKILKKIVTGGQTGVDRAGLDAAIEAGCLIGGYCPKGRIAEDGIIPDRYPLIETESAEYKVRTELNVINSDGTLIINKGELTGGTKATHINAVENGKPFLIVQLEENPDPEIAAEWIRANRIEVLNIAGPRESKADIYSDARDYLRNVFEIMEGL